MSERMNYQRNGNVTRRNPPRSQQQTPPPTATVVLMGSAPGSREEPFSQFAVAMTYTPWQRWGEVYSAEKGLDRGTIFPVLDMPFSGRRC